VEEASASTRCKAAAPASTRWLRRRRRRPSYLRVEEEADVFFFFFSISALDILIKANGPSGPNPYLTISAIRLFATCLSPWQIKGTIKQALYIHCTKKLVVELILWRPCQWPEVSYTPELEEVLFF
jgi:hypothetical protein